MADLKKRKRRIQHLKIKNTELNSADLNFDLEHVQAGISLLNAGDKALLALYIDDKPYQEIAEIIGITENNVGVRLNRIKKKLRESIKV